MQLGLSFSVLLASLLFALSSVDAAPTKRNAGMVTIPLKRAHNMARTDIHPQVLLQQHINRSHKRLARMTGRAEPSKRDMEEAIHKRMFIPPGGRPGVPVGKRYNRTGMKGTIGAALGQADSLVKGIKAKITGAQKAKAKGAANKGGKKAAGAAAAGAAAGAAAAGTVDSNSTDENGAPFSDVALTALENGGLTKANDPTGNNSIGLDIEANDVGYIGTIQMGTPPADFNMLMDSGSSDLWVGSENCVSEQGGDCGNHNFLGAQSSSTFVDTKAPFEVTYGTGNVQGTKITDNIVVAGLALDAHPFGTADQESVDFSSNNTPFDGIMGLAQSTLSEQGNLTPVESLAKAGLIQDAITSYKISRLQDQKNDGEVTFGGLDDTKFDPNSLVTFDNVNTQGFWEGAMDSVTVDGTDTGLSGRTAILDTGTTLIVAPPADALAVHQNIPGAASDGQGGFTVPCTTTASVALSFGGQSFAINPVDLKFQPVSNDLSGDCVSGISSGQIGGATEWLVGDVFLKNAYFSTDVTKNTISLATLV